MKDRLQTILNLEKLSAAQLASLLSIQRSTLSNLMSGRNNPSYDFILAVMTKLPNLNVEWLLRGEGQPYKNPGNNLRGERLNDTKTEDTKDSPSMRQENTKNTTETENGELSIFDTKENIQYESGNLFGIPEDEKQETAASDDLPENIMEDFPSEEEIQPYHPYPPLEHNELAERVKAMQQPVKKEVKEKIAPVEPPENPKFEENLPPTRQILPEKPARMPIKVLVLYSDGSFDSFEK